jgi:hypothetical protein
MARTGPGHGADGYRPAACPRSLAGGSTRRGIHPGGSRNQAFRKPWLAHQARSQPDTDPAGPVPHMNGEAELTIARDVTGIHAAHKYADFATSAIRHDRSLAPGLFGDLRAVELLIAWAGT